MTTYRQFLGYFFILFALFGLGLLLDSQTILRGTSTILTGAGLGVIGTAAWKVLRTR